VKDNYIQNFVNFYQGSYRSNSFVCPLISYHNFTNFLLSKTEADLNFEVLSRNSEIGNGFEEDQYAHEDHEGSNYYNKNEIIPSQYKTNNFNFSNSSCYLSYEIESSLSKLLEEEIKLIQTISNLLDTFFIDEKFKIFSIIRRLDKNANNSFNEIE
jgi:hypothetical protein